MARLPPWIRSSLMTDRAFGHVHGEVSSKGLHTVCQSARCPNLHECWQKGTATFLLLGGNCTRRCKFCAVDRGRPEALDDREPTRVAEAAASMKLSYVVLTSVTRDDLADGGAGVFAATIDELRRVIPGVRVEVLVPDFQGLETAMATVLKAGPDVFAHNIETVRRLQSEIRPQASYEVSMGVLRFAAKWQPAVGVKSGLMVGLGETDEEVRQTLDDLAGVGCRMVTIGQYLAPSRDHRPVSRFVPPEQFEVYAAWAREAGFSRVASAPLVRSSYMAEELMEAEAG